MSDILKIVLLVLFILLAVIFGPWLLIWAINTLVQAGGVTTFNIPFTFWTWLAAVILGGMSVSSISSK